MARIAREILERALTSPRPGFIDGAIDLRQARRAGEMTRIAADRAQDVVRTVQSGHDLVVMEKETEVRFSRLDLELDQIGYAQKMIELNTQEVDEEIVLRRLTFGDRARAALSEARVRAIHGEIQVTAARGHLREAQERAQLAPADYIEADSISEEFADFVGGAASSRRR
jgi:hypothetical protein